MARTRRQQTLRRLGLATASLALVGLLAVAVWARPAFQPLPDSVRDSLTVLDTYEPRSGDVLLVRGRSWRSRAVLVGDRDSPYSHVAIVYIDEAGEAWAIHAVPAHGESPGWILKQTLPEFTKDPNLELVTVYRLHEEHRTVAESAGRRAFEFFDDGVGFDDEFDVADRSELYCTELIHYAYVDAGLDLVDGEMDPPAWPVFDHPLLYPGSLGDSPYLHAIGRFPDDLSPGQPVAESLPHEQPDRPLPVDPASVTLDPA